MSNISEVRIGFWPELRATSEIKHIIDTLTDTEWQIKKPYEYMSVVKFLRKYDSRVSYKGSSTCRICGCDNGSEEYTQTFRRINFVYPEGFVHYITAHGIKPDQALIDIIMEYR